MKKTICIMLALMICLGSCAMLVGCGCDHVFSEEWSNDDTHHWHVCTSEDCAEQGDKAEHSFGQGVVTLAPTNTTPGVRKYTCEVCGKTKTEQIAPEPTVSEAEWAQALLLQDGNLMMSVVNNAGNLLLKKRGGIVMVTDPQTVLLNQKYYTVENEKYYCYTVEGEQVTKSEITQQAYAQATTLAELQALPYQSFTYNDTAKTYEVAQLSVGGVLYEGVSLAFAGKRVVRISFTKKEPGKEADVHVITVTYGTVPVDLALPQVTG